MKTRRHRQKKWKKTLIPLLVIIAATIIIISIAKNTPTQSNPNTKPADQYFEISNIAAIGELQNNGQDALINHIGFSIKPIGGDAHAVAIRIEGYPDYYYDVGDINKEQIKSIDLPLTGLLLHKEEEGFPLEIEILGCPEASGSITIYIPPDKIYP
jgi:hypothetical protein